MSKQIVFRENHQGLFVIDDETLQVRQLLADHSPFSFNWSPDGTHLAYLVHGPTREKYTQILYCMQTDGSHLHRLTEEKGLIMWNWWPDGKLLAFTSWEMDTPFKLYDRTLFLYDLASSQVRQIIKGNASLVWPAGTNARAFLWSADDHTVFVMDESGSNRSLLFQSDLDVSASCWSPDGTVLVLTLESDSSNSRRLCLLDANGKLFFQVEYSQLGIDAEAAIENLSWSPDSQKLAWTAQGEDEDEYHIYAMKLDDLVPRCLAKEAHREVGIAWSPDSQHLAFVEHGCTLGIIGADGENLHRYPMEGEDMIGDFPPSTPT